jgi:hypothetical protein
MIYINQISYDPKQMTLEDFSNRITSLVSHHSLKAEVHWLEGRATQSELLALYGPFIQALQRQGVEVHCLMSVDEAKRLVRYPKMMFIDPLFLRRFKFKSIRFQLPDVKKLST